MSRSPMCSVPQTGDWSFAANRPRTSLLIIDLIISLSKSFQKGKGASRYAIDIFRPVTISASARL